MIGEILNERLPGPSNRMFPQDTEEAARYWTQGAKMEDEEEEEEVPEAVLKSQERDQEGQDRVNIQERRDQEAAADQPRTGEITGPHGRITGAQVRRRSSRWVTREGQRQRQRAPPNEPPQLPSEEELSVLGFPQEAGRERVISDMVQDRMCRLRRVLTQELEVTKVHLEALLQEFQQHREDLRIKDLKLDDPVLLLIAQGACHRACRTDRFCPHQGCNAKLRNDPELLTHLNKKHEELDTGCRDLMRHYLQGMCPSQIHIKLKIGEEIVDRQWDVERCPYPGCDYFHLTHSSVAIHIKAAHTTMYANIQKLGWFWGSIRTMLKKNGETTIREAIGESQVVRCCTADCGKIFATHTNLNRHYSHDHLGQRMNKADIPHQVMYQSAEIEENQEEMEEMAPRSRPEEEANQPRPQEVEDELRQIRESVDTGSRRRSNPLQTSPNRQEIESERQVQHRDRRKKEFRRKRAEHCRNVSQGVNIPQMSQSEMRKVKEGLVDLFKMEINPMMKELQPKPDDWDDWLAFEGAYEEAMHLLRVHIMKALKKKPETMYGQRRINPLIQKARAEQSETTFTRQDIQRRLVKVKAMLEQIDESQEDSEAGRRAQIKIVGEINQFLNLIPPEARREALGANDLQTVWEELNQPGDHRTRVIGWLEAKIFEEIAKDSEGVAKRLQAWRVQDTYRTSKSVAMKRYVNKRESPPCPIEENEICDYFRETWGPPKEEFFEADEQSQFHIFKKLPDDNVPEEMMEYMLSDDNIRAVIRSRDDLSACGNDGISYRIMKAAGQEAVKFMRRIIKATIRCGRVFDSWKDARTVLIYKKGERSDPKNWRPITITNCTYRLYTCLMARAFQQVNSKYDIYEDVQNGFIKKSIGCSEHSIKLKELFQKAKCKGTELIITAIDFTNAFGSVPHKLIMSMLKMLNFPEWIRAIVKDIYEDSKSTIEYRRRQTRPIKWRTRAKQGCP
jgi:hypothetical protein